MRHAKSRRVQEKMRAREMSMKGWDEHLKEFPDQQQATSRGSQRRISQGMGHHLARMMKGHI